jgi:hypothetical protein
VIKFTSWLPVVGGSLASSTTKTGHHDIAESGVTHQKSINHLAHPHCTRTRNAPETPKEKSLNHLTNFTSLYFFKLE